MNSSNDPLDKLLQQRFQQLFDDEQVVPDTSLKQKIWDRLSLTAPRRSRPVGLLWLGVLFLVGGGLYYGAASSTMVPKRADLTKPHGVTQPVTGRHPAGRHPAGRHPAGRHSADPNSVSQAPVKPYTPQGASVGGPVDTLPLDVTVSITPRLDQSSLKRSVRPVASLTAMLSRLTRSPKKVDDTLVSWPRISQLAELPAEKNRFRRLIMPSSTQLQSADQELVPRPTMGVADDSSTSEPTPTLELSLLNRRSLERLLGNKGYSLLTRRVIFGAPIVAAGQTPSIRAAAAAEWFLTAAPLTTYQRMTIVAQTDTYVRDVSSPDPWSPPTWGYQVGGGVRRWGWNVALSYGQLRRWTYYERVINAYQVEPTGPTAYQVKRRTEAVAENVTLSLVGLGFSKQLTWGKHHRYYMQAGTQLTYVLTTYQPLGWFQAGWGLSLPVGKCHQLQVGPTLAYSLNATWSRDRQLLIQPYLLGASLVIQPGNP